MSRGSKRLHGIFMAVIGLLVPSPTALADVFDGVYGNLGIDRISGKGFALDAMAPRLGVRFGTRFAIEGEGSFGIDQKNFAYSNCPPGAFCLLAMPPPIKLKLDNAEAAYAVAYVPVETGIDLLFRAGFGTASYGNLSVESFNLGMGTQFMITDLDGLRLDYTRDIFTRKPLIGFTSFGTGSDVVTLSYVRTF